MFPRSTGVGLCIEEIIELRTVKLEDGFDDAPSVSTGRLFRNYRTVAEIGQTRAASHAPPGINMVNFASSRWMGLGCLEGESVPARKFGGISGGISARQ
jgi:hypothetical protein